MPWDAVYESPQKITSFDISQKALTDNGITISHHPIVKLALDLQSSVDRETLKF